MNNEIVALHAEALQLGMYCKIIKDILVKYVKERLSVEGMKYKRTNVFLTHTCLEHPEYVEACVEAVKETGLFDNVYATPAGATISSHCGPNTLGILFDTEE